MHFGCCFVNISHNYLIYLLIQQHINKIYIFTQNIILMYCNKYLLGLETFA